MAATGRRLSLDPLTAVVGVRGMGLTCARLLGHQSRLLLGDISQEVLDGTAQALRADGYLVETCPIDISDAASVRAFADRAAELGGNCSLVLTAGISQAMATAERIFKVNMVGTMQVLDAFEPLMGRGCSAVVISSSAAYMLPVSPAVERVLALGSVDEAMAAVTGVDGADTPLGAYCVAKLANQKRVQACAVTWAERGARINSVSPGIIATPMSAVERDAGSAIEATALGSPAGRLGQPMDIAAAVAWLMSPAAGFVTGIDLLVDGGMIASLRWGPLGGGADSTEGSTRPA